MQCASAGVARNIQNSIMALFSFLLIAFAAVNLHPTYLHTHAYADLSCRFNAVMYIDNDKNRKTHTTRWRDSPTKHGCFRGYMWVSAHEKRIACFRPDERKMKLSKKIRALTYLSTSK